ncbi:50S ribosomal protein L25 [bacterium]|nr:50S ribosomal protein L25 [bacterium]
MLKLKAKIRKITGKAVKQIRKEELIPAIFYGFKVKNQNLELKYREFINIYKQAGESTLIELIIDGKKPEPVLVHAVQTHPVSDKILHIDFLKVNLKKLIKTNVSLEFIGEALAVKDLGGILVRSITELEVQALPLDLPSQVRVDISSLKTFDDSIKISDLKVSKKIEILTDKDIVVATVSPPRTQEELEKLEEKPEQEIPEQAKEEAEEGEEAEKEDAKEPEEEKKEQDKS